MDMISGEKLVLENGPSFDTYATPGTYTVTLSVTDSIGFTITDTLQVTVTTAAP